MSSFMLVDTDVLIDYLRGHDLAILFLKNHSSEMILPSIVVAELYAGVRGDEELATLDALVSIFHVIPVNTEIAKAAGLLKRDYSKSHNLGLADAVIAATAQAESAELKTLNVKHYPMFPDLKPAYVKS